MIANFILLSAEPQMTTGSYIGCIAAIIAIGALAFVCAPSIMKNSAKR